ncbi:TetR/AcrR family transcriptional regulator [Bailinhaonella thermotolerans]|uniref:TetR/AcrR family transcriptional regulator n=1 Tax=Bailinhaonella thermotolerans TaxID=1070861 RepID=A0A3A4A3D0_9ACTN|nr:TetR/AcrR family transcriptional regulator [Bailinhaonella thermotolerans]RJL23276.1 TetR/AcrR family transcriptional regulator [Bailinhaonella thermotolerans]
MAQEDRRSRRSRRLLRDALVALVLERGYADITVEDITERADLGRATFYSHYTDKGALFTQIAADLQAELDERLRPLLNPPSVGFSGKPVLEMFRHAAEERDAYRVILRGEGDGRALRRLVDARTAAAATVFRARAEALGVTPRIDVEVLARAWVGEQIAVLAWWLESDPPRLSAEEVTRMLLDLSLRGRYWANGFEGEPPAAPQ